MRAFGGAVARGGDDLQVLAAGQVRVEARLLDDRPDARERLARLAGCGSPSSATSPEVGCVRPEQRADHRRLPGAVRAEEAEGDAGGDGQVDAVDRRAVAELLRQRVGLDHGFHAGHASGPQLEPTTSGKYGGASR